MAVEADIAKHQRLAETEWTLTRNVPLTLRGRKELARIKAGSMISRVQNRHRASLRSIPVAEQTRASKRTHKPVPIPGWLQMSKLGKLAIETGQQATKFSKLKFVPSSGLMWPLLLYLFSVCPLPAEPDPAALRTASDNIVAMEFFVAQGPPNSCGEGCDRWIAAEGDIDHGAAYRFRRFIEQTGDARLPVFFSSQGGELDASLELGRILRSRSMKAGVALTIPGDCLKSKAVRECSAAIRESPIGNASLWSANVQCRSGCAYAILGASIREISPDAYMGVHSTSVDVHELRMSQEDQRRFVEEKLQKAERDVRAYLTNMGIDDTLYSIAKQTKFQSLHLLTRRELYDFGIDRRESVQSGWVVTHFEFSANGDAALSSMVTKIPDSTTRFEQLTFAISCDYHSKDTYVLSVLRFISNDSARNAIDLKIGGADSAILLRDNNAFTVPYPRNTIEVRQSKLTRDAIEKLFSTPKIDITERPTGDNDSQSANKYSISTKGAKDVVSSASGRCFTPAR
jgi:hypothetical protein